MPITETVDPEEGFAEGLLKAVPRGIAGAASGVANLFGAGVEDNFGWGHSQGFIPGLVEGVTQFAIGFVPAAKALSALGAFSKLGKAASVARSVTAGAVADFAVFDGNDPRLSNLIESVPALSNPLTEFLASKPDDGEVSGRLKNVLEGAGLGAITDGLMHAFGWMRKANHERRLGNHEAAKAAEDQLGQSAESMVLDLTDDGVDATLDDPTSLARQKASNVDIGQIKSQFESKNKEKAAAKADGVETLTDQDLKTAVQYDPAQGPVIVVNTMDTSGVLRGFESMSGAVKEPNSRMSVLQLKNDAVMLSDRSPTARRLLKGSVTSTTDAAVREQALLEAARLKGYDGVTFMRKNGKETVVLNEKAIANRVQIEPGQSYWETIRQRGATDNPEVIAQSPLETAVRNMDLQDPKDFTKVVDAFHAAKDLPPEDLAVKIRGMVNLEKMGDHESAALQKALIETYKVQGSAITRDHEQLLNASAEKLSRMLGQDPHEVAVTAMVKAGNVADAAAYSRGIEAMVHMLGNEFIALGKNSKTLGVDGKSVNGSLSGLQIATMGSRMAEKLVALRTGAGRIRAELGRGLESQKVGVSKMAEHPLMGELLSRGVTQGRQLKILQRIADEADKYGFDHAVRQMTTPSRWTSLTNMVKDWYMFSLLSAPKTATTNIIGNAMTSIYRPLERALGAFVGTKLLPAARHAEFEQAARDSVRQISIMADSTTHALLHRSMAGGDGGSAWAGAVNSFKTGESTILPGSGALEGMKPGEGFSAENVSRVAGTQIDAESKKGKFLSWIQGTVNLPGRFLSATDEFFKQTYAQSQVRSELMGQARKLGYAVDDAERWTEARMQRLFVNGQAQTEEVLRRQAENLYKPELSVDPETRIRHIQKYVDDHLLDNEAEGLADVLARSLEGAKEVTFQKGLTDDRGILAKGGRLLNELLDGRPLVKMVVAPFIKTPLNILMFAAERMPVPGLNRDFIPMLQTAAHYVTQKARGLPPNLSELSNRFAKDLVHSDPRVAADALGRATAAVGLMGVFGTAAASGLITGKGPNDPEQLKVLKQTGWQPYSIKVGDTYVSYQRLDPMASMLSFYADWADISRFDSADTVEMGLGMLTATLTNLQSKSYLTGVTEAVKLLSDPVGQMKRTAGRIAGSFVPNALAATREFTDPHIAELEGIRDRVMSRIPFFTEGMDKQRNVLGEPLTKRTFGGALKVAEGIAGYMLPLQVNTTSSDTVTQELASLAYPFTVPKSVRMGLDLKDYKNERGQSAYDRWQELTGEVRIDGRTLRSTLERVIGSHEYQKYPQETLDKLDVDSPKVAMIRKTLGRFQREAERKMLKEFPEVQVKTLERRSLQAAVNSGAPASVLDQLTNR